MKLHIHYYQLPEFDITDLNSREGYDFIELKIYIR